MKRNSYILIFLGLLSLIILFHLAILIKLIPYDTTWGGRLKSDQEMYLFEGISILLNLFLVLILLIKGAFIKAIIPIKVVNILLWIFFSLFALNTIGNFFADNTFEKWMSLLTLIFVFLLWKILRSAE